MKRQMMLGAALASLVAIATGCSTKTSASGGGVQLDKDAVITIDGSSTVFPVLEAVAEEFQKIHPVKVTVGISGTGGGFKKFVRGETDISNASRPILEAEMAEAKKNGVEYIEVPICFDALTVVVHPENTWVDEFSVEELKKIWEPAAEGKVTKWSQVRQGWPDETIHLFGAGTDSGTFDYFTEAICDKAKSSRPDYTASEDDNVLVKGVEQDKYALGYLPFAYYEPHQERMKAVAIKWSKNASPEAVLPSMESVVKGTYNPLSRPLFIYVNAKSADKPEVKELIRFLLTEGPQLIKEVKYIPLPDTAYKVGIERLEKKILGSGFGGKPEVGLPVEAILERKPTL